MVNDIKQYDVVFIDLGTNMVGSEQGGKRPAIIIQNDIGNYYSNTTIVIPLSTKIKHVYQPTHTLIKGGDSKPLSYDSIALGECVRQISKKRIIKVMGHITDTYERKMLVKIYFANVGKDSLDWKAKHY